MSLLSSLTSRFGRLVRPAVIIFAVFLVALIAGGFWFARELRHPQEHPAANRKISIEQGASTASIISRLRREGIIAHEWPLRLYLRFSPKNRKFKAGDYVFKSPITPLGVISHLVRGEVVTSSFTIPEGYNQFDISEMIAGLTGMKQAPPENEEEVLELFKNASLIADLDPEAKTLEGYLFPDTYEYTATTTREQLVESMVKRFRRVYTAEKQKQASDLGMTTRQVLTLASLIEKEAKVDSERELISSVFHRRLKMGVQLACDPTVIYAALLAGKYRGKIYRSDLDRDSPYNTYQKAGLPPGPIASPGRRSIEAALNPAETDYLFFVVDAVKKDGSHKFSASSADHERAVKLLRQSEREAGK